MGYIDTVFVCLVIGYVGPADSELQGLHLSPLLMHKRGPEMCGEAPKKLIGNWSHKY